jgi:hypothetical protein
MDPIRFAWRKETPGAHCFQEVNSKGEVLKSADPDCVVGSLYIRKAALRLAGIEGVPQQLTVSIAIGQAVAS